MVSRHDNPRSGSLNGPLNPTPLTRLRQGLQPDWVHTTAARRVAAAVLVVLAAVLALRADPHDGRGQAVVATRDIKPGVAITAEDVRLESRFTETLPDGSQSDSGAVVGAMVAGPVRRGEVITDVRLLGARLTQASAGPDARVVPLQLADGAVSDLVRAGDVVDILAAPEGGTDVQPRVIATDAVVVSVPAREKTAASRDRVVLVALPVAAANTVAGATLVQAITLTLH
jgi:SAF domain